MQIYAIPALKSNYFWLLQPSKDSPRAFIFDPGDAGAVKQALRHHQLTLTGIVITHHHWDHTDGINDLLAHKSVPVYGPDSPRIPQVTHKLYHTDKVQLDNASFEVIATPGHTLEHIAYFQPDKQWLFSGDNIFGAGCGRLFEGTAAQFYSSLQLLSKLPESTLIYASHEYTLANIAFALAVEPNNRQLQQRQARERQKREAEQATLPSPLAQELATNPFLRCRQPQVRASAERYAQKTLPEEAQVFAALRQWKDNF